MRPWPTFLPLLALSLAIACGDDGPATDGGSSDSSGSGSGTTASTMTMTTASTMTMSGGGTSTGPADTTTDTTAGPADSTSSGGTTEGAETTSGSSDSGGGEPLYPPCDFDMDPACSPPYMACYDFAMGYSACTSPCENAGDCPVPTTGDAPVVCAGPMMDQCLLDCAGGETCPDGMDCVPVAGGMFNRCLWPNP